ncbi:MAG TPA: M18 family aminopeptidase [Firmicutes bacterium]|nr:M18 family aminopeptidase [Bacillota bacterium]
MSNYPQGLLDFIQQSPSCFHAIDIIKKQLTANGFLQLLESDSWELEAGKSYFVTRNLSSIIAFKVPRPDFVSFHIVASHSDSPTFKIKENAELEVSRAGAKYTQLNTERYGGMLCAPWFDRPLSVAGRVVTQENGKIQTHLVNIDRDLVLIPNLAIHMNRQANDGYAYNAQKDMVPLFGDGCAKGSFLKTVADSCNISEKDILSTDLFLYNRMPGTIWGANEEFISSPKLDDLECAYTSLQAFLNASHNKSASIYCVFDNEEVGSGTKQGADSTFLQDVLGRINSAFGRTREQFHMAVASSFMLSADNAHAIHPNHMDVSDPTNLVEMNQGIVIKYNANQKYTTDAVSAAVFKNICNQAGVPYQSFTNRSDMLGGSTLGNISNAHVSLNTVDIGLAQLAMHSCYETAGIKDIDYMIEGIKAFYNSCISMDADGIYQIER